jgi:hypothetical protein
VRSFEVRREPGPLAWKLLTVLPILALVACSKLSQVGNLPQATVKASAATVGQPYTTDSNGVMHTMVRAGADVVLTGVNSETLPDDTGVPVITWQWTQQNPGAYPVDLIKRTSEVSSFTAPQVTQATTLTFQLTATNANGVSASTQADVVVEPAPDADHFLTFFSTADSVTVTAITSAVVPKTGGAAYNATVPFTITVTKLVQYTDNNGVVHDPPVPVGQPTTYSGGWTQALGSGGMSCTDQRNPQFQVPIPSFNLDDMLADGSGNRLSDVMQASDIDLDPANLKIPPAVVYAQVQITSAALSGGVTPGVCVGTTASFSNAAAPNTLVVDQGTLTQDANPGGGPFDTSDSAHAYYSTIDSIAVDPTQQKSTLQGWLLANGMNMSQPNWGADAHAIYTNNYDLGLGRDMYLKANCPAGTPALSQMTPSQLTQAIGQCDVASVVVNYIGVQAAAENTNAIVAVAMEYSAATAGGPRITKFYAFAPDQRSGQLQRVTSVDLDHRGQKYLPAACVVCHGGTPGTVTGGVYSQGGDVTAGFLPWDLASLLYSDTDPGFSQKSEDAALKAQYTEANQLSQFKLLNEGTYLTAADPDRFALLRELLEGWYGGQGLPGASGNGYNANFIPAGWAATANGNPAGSDTFYTNVFARTCRMCHVMQVPVSSGGQFDNLSNGGAQGSGTAACKSTVNTTTLGETGGEQFPVGCYWQFAKLQNLAMYLSDARMPFARRTMDRLWVDPNGFPAAAGQQLIATLSQPSVNVVPAGTTTLVANPSFASLNTSSAEGFSFTAGGMSGDVTDWITLTSTDTTLSALLGPPSWQVCADPGTGPPASETCAGSSSEFPVVGVGGIPAAFQIPQTGNFLIELDAAGDKVSTAPLDVPKTPPVVQNLPTGILPLEPLTFNLAGLIKPDTGNGPSSSYTWWVSGLSNLTVAPQGGNSCTSQAQACPLTDPVTLTLTPSSSASAEFTVNVADADVPPNVGFATASPTVTQLPVFSGTAFICAYDYLFASTSGTQTVVSGVATCPNTSSLSALDLSQGFAPQAGYTLQVLLQCSSGAGATTSCNDSQWVSGTLAVNGTQLQYTPPLAFSTNSNTGGGSNTNQVMPNYELNLLDSSNNVAATTGWVSLPLQVRANVAWSDVVASVFQATPAAAWPSGWPASLVNVANDCHDCHTSQPAEGLVFDTVSQTAHTIYLQLCGSGSSCNAVAPANAPITNPSGTYVDTGNVLNSVVLSHPAVMDGYTGGHTGGNRCPGSSTTLPTSSATVPPGINSATPPAPQLPSNCDLQKVIVWIEDGANEF